MICKHVRPSAAGNPERPQTSGMTRRVAGSQTAKHTRSTWLAADQRLSRSSTRRASTSSPAPVIEYALEPRLSLRQERDT